MKPAFTVSLAAVAAVVVAANLVYWVFPDYLPGGPDTESPYGTLGGDFQLESLDGPVALSDFEGQAVMLFFGFTHCPDYCLASLAVKRQVLAQLPDHLEGRVKGLFVSVDPDRDDVQTLAEYTEFFHEDIIGVTGPKEDIDRITGMYGAAYHFEELPDSDLEYTVEHTTRTYLIGPQGTVMDLFSYNTPYTEMLERINEIL